MRFRRGIIGVVATSQYSVERDLKMAPGDSQTLAGYRFEFIETVRLRGPNYLADARASRSTVASGRSGGSAG
jgi:cytochrome c-type biogenesis protein CcmF